MRAGNSFWPVVERGFQRRSICRPSSGSILTIHAPVLPNGYVMQPGEQFHANAWYKTPGGNVFQAAHTCPDTMVVPFTQYTAKGSTWEILDFVNHQVWTMKLYGDGDSQAAAL